MVWDVLWPLLQGSKKQSEGGRGKQQLLEPFCLYLIGQTQAYGHSCVQKVGRNVALMYAGDREPSYNPGALGRTTEQILGWATGSSLCPEQMRPFV